MKWVKELLEALVYQLLAGLTVGAIVGGIVGGIVVATDFKSEKVIVSHGCGEYNSTTAKFQWVEKD